MDIYAHDDTVYHVWNTRGGDGEPITMPAAAVAVYKDGSTTPMVLDPAPTLDIDRGVAAVIGCHLLTLVLSDEDFVAGFYEVRFTAGTVDGISYVGVVCLEFRIKASDLFADTHIARQAAAGPVTIDRSVTPNTITVFEDDGFTPVNERELATADNVDTVSLA